MCFLLLVTGAGWETEWLLRLFSYVFNSIANCSETIKPMHAWTKRHLEEEGELNAEGQYLPLFKC